MGDILAVDIGTTAFKVGVFAPDMTPRAIRHAAYDVNIYGGGRADVDPERWWEGLVQTCGQLRPHLRGVDVVSLSVTTPGLVAIADNGEALTPAILFFDGRSHEQARRIRESVGDDYFLEHTCNLPVSGGSSLASILWIRDNLPDVWAATAKFGHCNTYIVKRLTGEWAIDPSTSSITGLYNTALDDMRWNERILSISGIPREKLPPLIRSHMPVGTVRAEVAAVLGVPETAVVLCGGNDAVLAALSAGVQEPGDISAVHGTCDITAVCVDRPVRSPNFNLRCHVLPSRWLTFFVMNTGGKALEWFHDVFCSEMTEGCFFNEYIPGVIESFLGDSRIDGIDERLPDFTPYLQGSRYSLGQEKAAFSRLTLETSREEMLLGLMKGIMIMERANLEEVSQVVPLGTRVMTSGGAARIRGFLDMKARWTGHYEYCLQEHSSLKGAALVGVMYQEEGSGG